MPRENSEPCSLGRGKVIAETEKAICFKPDGLETFWVPKSVVSEDSDVTAKNDEGELFVAQWWAEKEGHV